MDKNGLFVAALLDSAGTAYAAGIASRMFDDTPQYETVLGFRERTRELELHLRLLAESLAAGRPQLFAAEISWLKILHNAKDRQWGELACELDAMESELLARLPANAHAIVVEHLHAARTILPEWPLTVASPLEDDDAPHIDLCRRYLLALLEGRGRDAIALVTSAADEGVGIDELQDRVIIPTQQELGRMWQLGEIHVGEEHFGTQITEEALTLLRSRLPAPEVSAPCVVAAGTSGSRHDLGLRIAADRLAMAGWRTHTLGADVPPEDCVRTAVDAGARLVALSVPMLLDLRQAFETVSGLKELEVPVLVGGRVLAAVDDLWEVLGADAVALSAAEVVPAAERALSTRS